MDHERRTLNIAAFAVIVVAFYVSEIYGLIPGNDLRIVAILIIPLGIIFLYLVLTIPYTIFPKDCQKRNYLFMGLESIVVFGIVVIHWIMDNFVV
jgi:hypothetical protein